LARRLAAQNIVQLPKPLNHDVRLKICRNPVNIAAFYAADGGWTSIHTTKCTRAGSRSSRRGLQKRRLNQPRR
jgi:hypothetical protein